MTRPDLLTRLLRLRWQTAASELRAEPGTPEHAQRALRADRWARAYRAARVRVDARDADLTPDERRAALSRIATHRAELSQELERIAAVEAGHREALAVAQ